MAAEREHPDFRALFESAPGNYLVLDPDLTVVAVSDDFLQTRHRQRSEVVGHGIFDVIREDPRNPGSAGISNLRTSLERVRDQKVRDTMALQRFDLRRPDEEGGGLEERYWSPVSSPVLGPDGELRYIIHRVEDVTRFVIGGTAGEEANRALRAANEALQEQKETLDRFFTLSIDMLCISSADGFFKRLNPAFEKLGYTVEELLSKPYYEFVHPDDLKATEQEVIRQTKEGQTVFRFENRYRAKDGTYRLLQWTSRPDDRGFMYAAARDITDQRRAEEERVRLLELLQLQNEEISRASRAKTDFLAMMSHELRTPLNSIIGFSEVLIDGKFGSLNDRQSRYLNNVLSSGRHLLQLINGLLDFSKVEAGKLDIVSIACSVRGLVHEAFVTLQPLADARRVKLVTDPPDAPPLPMVSADPVRAKQILYNFLSNAIKFSPIGGSVVVHSSLSQGRIRCSVKDSGPGISAEDQGKLFTPFTQLLRSSESSLTGTGLGLALSRQLAQLMDGTVGVESRVGEGSVFYFELPISDSAATAPMSQVDPAARPLALIVDDDAGSRELLELSLQQEGFRTLIAATGEGGVALARRFAPTLILLDVYLPGIDGWDALRQLRDNAETARIPVFIASISTDRQRAFDLGAVEHLIKPIDQNSLLSALRRHNFTTQRSTG